MAIERIKPFYSEVAMSLYKHPGCKNWTFQIWTQNGKRIRKSTETDNREKAEIIEQTFRLGLKGLEKPARLHSMLDAVCNVKRRDTSVEQILPLYCDWLKTSGKVIGKRTLENRVGSVRRLSAWIKDHYPAASTV
jgi:hypothetical protein